MKRIAAVVLSQLACEIARQTSPALAGGDSGVCAPLAVVFSEPEEETSAAAEVGAVCERAHARGVRPGMRVAEAMARSAELAFGRVSPRALVSALGAVAEVAMEFGATVEVARASPLDTVWIDVTGAAHLFGGEASLCDEIESRIATLGHRARVAIAGGPSLARSFARFATHEGVPRVSPPGADGRAVRQLPIAALPIGADAAQYFTRLGVLSVADLARLDRSQLVSRLEAFLGPSSSKRDASAPSPREVLAWLDGIDLRPLVPYAPPEVLVEEQSFEDGVETAPQLVFALRHAVSKLSARLTGRRQAANRIDLDIAYDRTIFALRSDGSPSAPAAVSAEPRARLFVDLPAPLSHTDDLFRAVKAKIERLELAAPAVRIVLALSRIVRAPEVQLDLSRDVAVSPDALPALLSELSAEIGTERVGVLSVVDDHRPERRTRLVGIAAAQDGKAGRNVQTSLLPELAQVEPGEPSRLLPEPVPLVLQAERLEAGVSLWLGRESFVVKRIAFDRRLDTVAWWSSSPSSRDYLRVTLEGVGGARSGVADAWVFVDRLTGVTMLQGWWE